MLTNVKIKNQRRIQSLLILTRWRIKMFIKSSDFNKCSGCYACALACPKKCIQMEKNEEGFWYPKLNEKGCIQCGKCEKVCPAIIEERKTNVLNSYAAINPDQDCRKESSSGGVFSVIAEYVLKQNGIVYGAAMSEDSRSVLHIEVTSIDELYKLRGSKYVQSNVGGIFFKVKKLLENNMLVLFSGTPCQVAGLKKYLAKEYKNLITVDLICHGVASPFLLEKYLRYYEEMCKQKIKSINFRYKKTTWQDFGILKTDIQGTEMFHNQHEDPFMKMYLKNYCLRESCYDCSTKKIRYSDITLGDFWGIEEIDPQMNDNMGTSAIIVRTEKGAGILEKVRERLKLQDTTYNNIVWNNVAENISVKRPRQRDQFYKDLHKLSFDKVIKKYERISHREEKFKKVRYSLPIKILRKIYGKIRRIFRICTYNK